MLRNIQNDDLWKNDSMGMEGDTLGKYGCFVTCLANIMEITPREMNKKFQIENVYKGIHYPGEESEIDYMRARRCLNISFRKLNIKEIDTQTIDNVIVCYSNPFSPSGIHFVNCVLSRKDDIQIFDVFNGRLNWIAKKMIIGAYALYK